MTIEQRDLPERTANGTNGSESFVLPDRDVRRKRPPALSFLLRLETMRRVARVASLLALDYVGVVAAIYTDIATKLLVHGQFRFGLAWHDSKHWFAFAYLITVLMFARADL